MANSAGEETVGNRFTDFRFDYPSLSRLSARLGYCALYVPEVRKRRTDTGLIMCLGHAGTIVVSLLQLTAKHAELAYDLLR